MSFIRYKKFGKKEYAYEITAYWDRQQKKSRQDTKYLGVVIDKESKIFKKKEKNQYEAEKLILDFGDTYILHDFMKKAKLLKCKVYDGEILVQELVKQQKKVVDKLNIIVPKKMGV